MSLTWHFYDINGNMLSRLTGIIAGQPFTTPVNTFSLAFSQTLSTGKGGADAGQR